MNTPPVPPAPVTVWVVRLDQPAGAAEAAAAMLSGDEQDRAARFHFPPDRDRFVMARAALRGILGGCLGVAPAAVRFTYTPAGKPALAPAHAANFSFNLSHSGALALVAVAPAAVGVDVEFQRQLPDLPDIARRFFAAAEAARLLALPPDEQAAAFYRCWTRKEAYLKARGDGIAAGLDRFEVSFLPGEPPALLRTLDEPAEAARWSLLDLTPAADFAAAVAVRAVPATLKVFAWPE